MDPCGPRQGDMERLRGVLCRKGAQEKPQLPKTGYMMQEDAREETEWK